MSLGLACLGGAPASASAFFDSDYMPYPYGGYGGGGVYVRLRAPVRVPAGHARKRPEPTKTAEPAKPQPPKPAGPLIIAVSIGSQRVTVYDNGLPIATAPVSTGMQGHLTPMGVFSVIQKERWHRSNLYSNAPMPYMQRITWSGVALHAGVLPGYPASHGCIRLPEEFAVRLWGMTRVGARVVVTRNDVKPFEIEHPRLATLVKTASVAAAEARNTAAEPSSGGAGSGEISSGPGALVSAKAGPPAAHLNDVSEDHIALATAVPLPMRFERLTADDGPTELRPALDVLGPEWPVPLPQARPPDASLRSGPISLFVSRKEGKLFVRKGFEPLFDVPVVIARREVPLGTHVFTAGRAANGAPGLRWLAVSIINDRPAAEPERLKGKPRGARVETPADPSAEALLRAAAEALDRIELPPDVLERIAPLVTPGASLLIADQGLGGETGKETDFIVVTH
jgi:hypothetical protein